MHHASSAFADPNAYRAIFFEETQDHLADVEAILLRLESGAPDADQLNAIFRAIHSIKGSASMLGCGDVAELAHLQENLLDVLRKHERPLEPADVGAMLTAGDTMRAQVLRHRDSEGDEPDSAPARAQLREQLARPRADSKGAPGPVVRRFAVTIGPLETPVDPAELETMLEGLADMGGLERHAEDNFAGGTIAFEVELEGTADDLQDVLSLLVPPGIVTIVKVPSQSPAPAPATPAAPLVPSGSEDEFFVDPDEFRRKREALLKDEEPPLAAPSSPRIDDLQPVARDGGFIRVSTEKIDLLVNLVGELVITEAMLARSASAATEGDATPLSGNGLADLSRHTRNLQEAVLAIRMLPISNVFSRFPRLVHELSGRLGKRVELRFEGEATELDRGLIEKIVDPLTHLVRNAIDHGIESPEHRIEAGKAAAGTLRLTARQRAGNIVIDVTDDGRGLDRQRILEQAVRRGIAISPDARDEEVFNLIFEPGFTTASEVTDISGRGVGMDVVRRNIKALGGTIELASIPGEATSVTVSVPLTLAIIEAITIGVGSSVYVLPIASVIETLSLKPGDIHTLPGRGETLQVRDVYLPVVHLARVFPPPQLSAQGGGLAIIVDADGRHAVLIVDEVLGQQQVVVKSLEANFRKVPGLSGATVMGDGSVALILDVPHLVRLPQ